MIILVTGFISLSLLSIVSASYVGKQPVAWKDNLAQYWLKELQESMGRCTGHHSITEIMLKTVLNTIQSINLFIWHV